MDEGKSYGKVGLTPTPLKRNTENVEKLAGFKDNVKNLIKESIRKCCDGTYSDNIENWNLLVAVEELYETICSDIDNH